MARHGVTADAATALDRLAYMGKRGVGALEFRPARGSHSESAEPLRMKSLVEAARQVLHGDLSDDAHRSEEHTSELQSLMRNSYAVFCLKKKKKTDKHIIESRK